MNITRFIKEARRETEGYSLERFLVVNPYPVTEFFHEIAIELQPKHCHLLIDDGWSKDRVENIIQVLEKQNVRVISHRVKVYGNSSGLVHAKLYLFVWKNNESKWLMKLYFGSPNAGPQGFGLHAEVLAEINFNLIPATVEESARKYFISLLRGERNTLGVSLYITNGIRLWLPTICCLAESDAPTLDSWIRSGRLCHKYALDPSFGKLMVKLRRPFQEEAFVDPFVEEGLGRESQSDTRQHSYIGGIVENDAHTTSPIWYSKYFIETNYGYWTSDDCYREQDRNNLTVKGNLVKFQTKGADERLQIINKVKDAENSDREHWISEFKHKLNKVILTMVARGQEPNDYLFVTFIHNSTVLDMSNYRENCSNSQFEKIIQF